MSTLNLYQEMARLYRQKKIEKRTNHDDPHPAFIIATHNFKDPRPEDIGLLTLLATSNAVRYDRAKE